MLQPKYGCGATSRSRVDPQKNSPHFGSHIVIKTIDGRSCKICIISTSATYILHTHEKGKKKWSSQQKMELTNNSE